MQCAGDVFNDAWYDLVLREAPFHFAHYSARVQIISARETEDGVFVNVDLIDPNHEYSLKIATKIAILYHNVQSEREGNNLTLGWTSSSGSKETVTLLLDKITKPDDIFKVIRHVVTHSKAADEDNVVLPERLGFSFVVKEIPAIFDDNNKLTVIVQNLQGNALFWFKLDEEGVSRNFIELMKKISFAFL